MDVVDDYKTYASQLFRLLFTSRKEFFFHNSNNICFEFHIEMDSFGARFAHIIIITICWIQHRKRKFHFEWLHLYTEYEGKKEGIY